MVQGRAGGHVLAEAHQAEFPADADGAGTVGVVELRVELFGGVAQRERRRLLRAAGGALDGDVDPRHPAAHLPGEGEVGRRVAGDDLAACVALDLEAATEPQVALDGGEPAGDALGVGDGVPEVVGGRRVGAARDHDLRRLAVVGGGLDGAGDRAQVLGYVEHGIHCFSHD